MSQDDHANSIILKEGNRRTYTLWVSVPSWTIEAFRQIATNNGVSLAREVKTALKNHVRNHMGVKGAVVPTGGCRID